MRPQGLSRFVYIIAFTYSVLKVLAIAVAVISNVDYNNHCVAYAYTVVRPQILVSVSRPDGQGIGLGLET